MMRALAGAMQDFARLRVLATLRHSRAYGGGSMCAQMGKRPARVSCAKRRRARPAQFVPS